MGWVGKVIYCSIWNDDRICHSQQMATHFRLKSMREIWFPCFCHPPSTLKNFLGILITPHCTVLLCSSFQKTNNCLFLFWKKQNRKTPHYKFSIFSQKLKKSNRRSISAMNMDASKSVLLRWLKRCKVNTINIIILILYLSYILYTISYN